MNRLLARLTSRGAALASALVLGCAQPPAPPAPVAQPSPPLVRTEPPPLTPLHERRIAPVSIVDPVIPQVRSTASRPEPVEIATGATHAVAAEAPADEPFRTRYAYYEPASFRSLPGWDADRTVEAWPAFLASCRALHRNPAWDDVCRQARSVDARGDVSIRRFFESHFALYQIHEPDRSPLGVITGYYEPLLRGSRTYGSPYVHPVYGVPRDLVYVEARRLPRQARERPVGARLEGRTVIPLSDASARAAADAAYVLEIRDVQPDVRDKRIRLRVAERRIVPYYTRGEIERARLANADVLAWIEDRAALYSMQIQGSGKLRLPDGKILRLAYAEQNGRPFVPALRTLAQPAGKAARAAPLPLTRGLALLARSEDSAEPYEPVITRSLKVRPLEPAGPAYGATSPEVARVIEMLRPRRLPASGATGVGPSSGAQPVVAAATPGGSAIASRAATAPGADPGPASSDPSYVFFRPIPDSPSGPIGALGVPLTAGRSVAVDPRTTPLGFPVFIATAEPGGEPGLNRLVLAQDTGGAIRGAVRADYFWGFGAAAGAAAGRMNELGRMWLLMPKGQPIAALAGRARTRGADGGPDRSTGSVDCLVPDPEFCVED
jgi:membrane-bound lytic murein transglycosylase A